MAVPTVWRHEVRAMMFVVKRDNSTRQREKLPTDMQNHSFLASSAYHFPVLFAATLNKDPGVISCCPGVNNDGGVGYHFDYWACQNAVVLNTCN